MCIHDFLSSGFGERAECRIYRLNSDLRFESRESDRQTDKPPNCSAASSVRPCSEMSPILSEKCTESQFLTADIPFIVVIGGHVDFHVIRVADYVIG